ncbi:hypothetical protein CHUAL_003416 [Chamberlinius hualienensis]
MSDTWNDIQEFKKRQSNIRERFNKRRKEREEIVQSLTADLTTPITSATQNPTVSTISTSVSGSSGSVTTAVSSLKSTDAQVSVSLAGSPRPVISATESTSAEDPASATDNKDSLIDLDRIVTSDPVVERKLLQSLCELSLNLPVDSRSLMSAVSKACIDQRDISHFMIEYLLQKFSAQELITIKEGFTADGKSCLVVTGAEHTKLIVVASEIDAVQSGSAEDVKSVGIDSKSTSEFSSKLSAASAAKKISEKNSESIESLLSLPSTREKENKKMGEEILELLSKPTAKEKSLVERFKSQGGAQVREFCPHGTKSECMKLSGSQEACRRLHFKKIIQKHTDDSLGDCSFLNTCFHMDTCKYVHYEVDHSNGSPEKPKQIDDKENVVNISEGKPVSTLFPPQWVQCDLRYFDMTILGKFAVVMADPPWDIHMELPYGTMSDNEMRQLNIPALQDEGLIFLWVTGRAMELGRECLKLWGYERCDELIWVKTNQLQRIIRTGRTGHWLNHGKEHCLVGMKGSGASFNRGLDCDVIVAEVRATSHKPDEIYGIIERLSPGTRKIELFGRPHNVQPNWITLGNQLDGVRVIDPELIARFRERYPDGNCMTPQIKP